MLIKEIELRNFRIYKGKNIINLLPTDDKNIIVVSGKNGYGKTTFLVSLVWCLYGRQMSKVDNLYEKEIKDKGGYAKYITSCLNRSARLAGDTKFSVSITLQGVKVPDITCNEVKITRSYDVITNIDSIKVLIDGYENQITKDLNLNNKDGEGEEIFIRDFILPMEIAKFFLFDAEKIVSLAEINQKEQKQQLSRAYSEVLGIKKYEDLKNELEGILDTYRKKSATTEQRQEFNRIKVEIENLDMEEKNVTVTLEELKDAKDEKQSEIKEIENKLAREGKTMTIEELNELRKIEDEAKAKQKSSEETLKSLYDLIPFGLSGEILAELSDQLKTEQEIQLVKYQQEDLMIKIEKILNDIEKERVENKHYFDTFVRDFYEGQIKTQIKKYFYSDIPEIPSNFDVLHEFANSQYNDFKSLILDLKHSFKGRFEQIHNEFSTASNTLEKTRRRVREAEKDLEDEYFRQDREKKEKLEKEIISIENEMRELDRKIGSIRADIKKLKQDKEHLRKIIDASREYTSKEKVIGGLLRRIKTNIHNFQIEKKKSLEKEILSGLNTLLHKKDFIKHIEVDISRSGENIDIILKNERGEKLDKISLSMGERQMYASALLNALVNESDIEFPVFIDSPMQKFDEEHAENIIKYFYPNVSKQVVIFPLLNKELTAKEYNILKNKVSKSYIIENISNDASRFKEVEPENFMST